MCIRGKRAHAVVWKAVEFFEHKSCLFGTVKSLRQPLCPRGHLHSSRSFPLASHLLSSLMAASLSLDRQPARAPGKETPLRFYYLSGKPTSLFIEEHEECQADNNQVAKKPNEQHNCCFMLSNPQLAGQPLREVQTGWGCTQSRAGCL